MIAIVWKFLSFIVGLIAARGFIQPPLFPAERIVEGESFLLNLTSNPSAPSLRILEHTITPHDVSLEQLKLTGRYVLLAPEEDNMYFVGFEQTVNKNTAAKEIISDLIQKHAITSVYKVKRTHISQPMGKI
ncbi:uncharacterized protein LOC129753367 [Uranotaenia lowii]|uniref:uncharacterized protein LOC129753367 n=1 Tax=Uranotaenia lowii TaxID=190385 RepID=UPI00247A31B3|nr:uncharacterized protein LOC129753367 [Uranotaenia lowii]